MAHIFDTRNSGGEFVILGDALTLPSSSNPSQPMQGSLRYNPQTVAFEFFDPDTQNWLLLSSSGSGSGNFVPVFGNTLITGNITINGNLSVTGDINGSSSSGGANPFTGGSGVIAFDLSSYVVTATNTSTSRTLGNRFGEYLDLKDFGAVGDGVTDDTAAVSVWWNTLVLNGLPGFVPTGTYLITSPIIWDLGSRQTGVTIFGTGTATSVFDVTNVNSSPAVSIICSNNSSAYNVFKNIGFYGNLSCNVCQIGKPDFSDVMDNSDFDLLIINNNSSVSSSALSINFLRSSDLHVVAYCSGHGTAMILNGLCYSKVSGSFTNADTGLYFTNGVSFGNTFDAIAVLQTGLCILIDSINASQNNFFGGAFDWSQNAVSATAGSNNVFFNVSNAGSQTPFLATNAVGITVSNGNVTNVVASLGYVPLNVAGDTMLGNLVLKNNVALNFVNNSNNSTNDNNTQLVYSDSSVLSLFIDNGNGGNQLVFSVSRAVSPSIAFSVPVVANVNGNSSTASSLNRTMTVTLTGDVTGVISFTGASDVTSAVSLTPSTQLPVATYNQVAIDVNGRVVSGSSIVSNNSAIVLMGDVVGNGTNGVINTVLSDTGINPGTYVTVSVDSKGRVVNGLSSSSFMSTSGGTFIGGIVFNGHGIGLSVGFIDSQNNANTGLSFSQDVLSLSTSNGLGGARPILSVSANSVASPLTISANTVVYGNLSVSGGISGIASSASKFSSPMTLNVLGDVTGTVSFDGSTTANISVFLGNNGVIAGTYTQVVIDATGRVTNATNTTQFVNKSGDTLSGNLILENSLVFASQSVATVGLASSNALVLTANSIDFETGSLTWNSNTIATLINVNGVATQVSNLSTQVSELQPIIGNVAMLVNIRSYVGGPNGYATDGRKPSEFDSNRNPLVGVVGSGVPVFYGYASYANVTNGTPSWISTIDGFPVES